MPIAESLPPSSNIPNAIPRYSLVKLLAPEAKFGDRKFTESERRILQSIGSDYDTMIRALHEFQHEQSSQDQIKDKYTGLVAKYPWFMELIREADLDLLLDMRSCNVHGVLFGQDRGRTLMSRAIVSFETRRKDRLSGQK